MKRLSVLVLAAVFGGAATADAAIINFGVDIKPDESTYQVGFYDGQPEKGGNDGATLWVLNQSLTFNILTPGLAGATINGFELFIDATDVECTRDGCDGDWLLVFLEDAFGTKVAGYDFGYLQDTSGRSTEVPVEGGPLGTHAPSPYSGDIDNTFFLRWAPGDDSFAAIADAIVAGTLGIAFDWAGLGAGSARIDGVNLQVDYTPAPPVAEPVSLLLVGMGLIAAGRRVARRA